MSKGSSPQNVTTTTESEPSEYIRPYLDIAMDDSRDLYQSQSPNFFPEATYVGFDPATETALQLAQNRALAGNPLLQSSQSEINKILSGDYLNPNSNPYSQGLFNQMADDVTSKVNSQFTKAGRFGSGANQEILADSLGDLANKVYGDQYNQERANMVNATSFAPQLGQMDYDDIQALASVGAERETLDTAKLQDAVARFDYEQQKPYLKLGQYLGALGSNVPTTTVSTQPVFRNTGAGLLSGALSGAKIGGMIDGVNPLYSAIGGGLLGGFA